MSDREQQDAAAARASVCQWCGARAVLPAAPGTHELKTDPDTFDAVASGAKTYEIRMNDRGFKVGDVLVLRRTASSGADMRSGAQLVYTGEILRRTVSHILTGYGLLPGWCVLSFDAAKLPDGGLTC